MGIGGIAGREPVAITKRRARTFVSPTVTVCRSMKRAAPFSTVTPSPVNRSTELFGSIAAMTLADMRHDGGKVGLRRAGDDAEIGGLADRWA